MHIFNKAKVCFKKVFNLLRYYTRTREPYGTLTNQPFAVINLDSFLLNTDMGRFSFILAQILKFSGFKVVIYLNRKFFLSEAPYKQRLLKQDYIRLRKRKDKGINIITLHSSHGPPKTIELVHGYQYIHQQIQAWHFPFPLHPSNYEHYLSKDVFNVYRKTKKKFRVFFAGNTDSYLYNRDIIRQTFNMLPRFEVIDHIKNKYAEDDRVKIVGEESELNSLLETGEATNKVIISEAKTASEKWLEILSSSNFFICLPGVRMPWSHNAFEAMSVGTIPIIQYGTLFQPQLEHMKNCIAYQSLEDFDAAIETALSMSKVQLDELKHNVITYYDGYLSTEVVISKIQNLINSDDHTLKVVASYLEDKENPSV